MKMKYFKSMEIIHTLNTETIKIKLNKTQKLHYRIFKIYNKNTIMKYKMPRPHHKINSKLLESIWINLITNLKKIILNFLKIELYPMN
jgi:hypothetical protein